MTIIYCCLERDSNKDLKFQGNNYLTLEKSSPCFNRHPPISVEISVSSKALIFLYKP